MSDDRLRALEENVAILRDTVEARSAGRDQQLGLLATEGASIKAGISALAGRVELVEIASRPPSFLSVWGPAAASLGLVATIGGSFLTMIQREQDSKLEIVESHIDAASEKIDMLRIDTRFLDAQIRITERDFRGSLAATGARLDMLEKLIDNQ